ncbi:hypothetical protein IMZ31_19710 (plasmid) [Pontibacillus sp. ALD_SL1]|uniref:hypothetical protein n=1 Tax=Pontibacillus sp. ALD_SL1 TaxID=2777185 RepID=UPI001A96C516|nr:hypothetical protein [Pontibacillus sp. ALD_SL1]QST02779.1 hypothetical protein IMZ31_19710 [Pontibacillus sp. ALD_SL1]
MKKINGARIKTQKGDMPRRSTIGSAGFDIFAWEDVHVKPGSFTTITLPFSIEGGEENQTVSFFVRSSYGIKKGLRLSEDGDIRVPGITKKSYEPFVLHLHNVRDEHLHIPKGEHFIQMVIGDHETNRAPLLIEEVSDTEKEKSSSVKGHVEESGQDGFYYVIDEEITFGPKEQKVIPTGLKGKVEEGTWLKVIPHIHVRPFLMLANQVGVVDCDYYNNSKNEGNLFLALVNTTDDDIRVIPGTTLVSLSAHPYLVAENEIQTNRVREGGSGTT